MAYDEDITNKATNIVRNAVVRLLVTWRCNLHDRHDVRDAVGSCGCCVWDATGVECGTRLRAGVWDAAACW